MIDEYILAHLLASLIFYNSISQKGKDYMPLLLIYFLVKLTIYVYAINRTEWSSDKIMMINFIMGMVISQ